MDLGIGLGMSSMRSGRRTDPVSPLFAAGEAGDDWHFWRDWCYTRSAGGVYERVTTTGDAIARVVGRAKGIYAEQLTPEARPLYGESGALGWGVYDGVDDSLSTESLTPGADKAQIFTGMNKVSAASQAMIVEHSTNTGTNNGALNFRAVRTGGTEQADAASKGTVSSSAIFTIPLGISIVTVLADIAGDSVIARRNGAQVQQNGGDQGAGQYLSHRVFIGARNGSGSFFHGNIHSLTLRFGPNLTADQITAVEAVVAARTGVSL